MFNLSQSLICWDGCSIGRPKEVGCESQKSQPENFSRRRKSSSSSAARGGLAGLSPSPRSKSGRTRLKLEVTTPGLASRKVSHDSQPTPIPTVSEMSEGLLSPKSPLFDILNIRDVSDVISEDIELETNHECEEQKKLILTFDTCYNVSLSTAKHWRFSCFSILTYLALKDRNC